MRQLKQLFTLLAVILAIAFTACEKEGPSGPMGEQGPAGPKGDKGDPGNTGPRGEPGSSNIFFSDWIRFSPTNSMDDREFMRITIPQDLGTDVLEDNAYTIMVYRGWANEDYNVPVLKDIQEVTPLPIWDESTFKFNKTFRWDNFYRFSDTDHSVFLDIWVLKDGGAPWPANFATEIYNMNSRYYKYVIIKEGTPVAELRDAGISPDVLKSLKDSQGKPVSIH